MQADRVSVRFILKFASKIVDNGFCVYQQPALLQCILIYANATHHTTAKLIDTIKVLAFDSFVGRVSPFNSSAPISNCIYRRINTVDQRLIEMQFLLFAGLVEEYAKFIDGTTTSRQTAFGRDVMQICG